MIACELCFPGVIEIGELAPHIALVLHNKNWCLIWGNGHDVLLTFQVVPWPDPDPECRDDLTLDEEAAADKWFEDADDAFALEEWNMPPDVGHAFCLACEKAGWPKDGHRILSQWVFNRAGEMIAKWKEETKPSPPGTQPLS